MNINNLPISKKNLWTGLRIYLLLVVIQGLVALVIITQAKSEESSNFIHGLSYTKLIIGSIILVVSIFSVILLVETWTNATRFQKRVTRLFQIIFLPKVFKISILFLGGLILSGSYFITLVPDISEPFVFGVFSRLLPVAIWITGLSIQTIISLLILNYGTNLFSYRLKGKAFVLITLLLLGIFLSWFLVMKAVHTMEFRSTGWNSMGVPILEYQLLIAWGAGMVTLLVLYLISIKPDHSRLVRKLTPLKIDIIISLLIWLVAFSIWGNVPVIPSWFLSAPTPPNFESYPTSDARAYDVVGQTALIGEGYLFYGAPIIRRPLHALYVTVLHLIGGQNSNLLVSMQILVLALFPVLVFNVTKSLHNRISGVIAGIMIVLREANSIAGAGMITTSHAKLIMVDLPSALLNTFFILLVIKWLKEIEYKKLYALISGGALGLSMMIRLESFVFFFPLAIIMMVILFPKRLYSLWIKNVILFLLGITLILSPWIWRNWKATGMIYIDSPYFRYSLIAQRFRALVTSTPESRNIATESPLPTIQEGEPEWTPSPQMVSPITSAEPTALPSSEEENVQTTIKQAVSFIKENPKQLVGFFLAHSLNSQIQTFLIMPSTFRGLDSMAGFLGHHSFQKLWIECCSLENYIRRMPYWHNWDGSFPKQSVIPLVANMSILATGVYISWRKHKYIGITPLIFGATYLLFNALFRNSGGRYILPVDWTIMVYFSIGLAHLSVRIIDYFSKSNVLENLLGFQEKPASPRKPEYLLSSPKFYVTIIILFLFACAIPLVEISFPQIFTETRKQEMFEALYQSDLLSEAKQRELQTFLSNGGLVYAGRALYPQYYRANSGGIGDKGDSQSQKPYARLIFYLIGKYNSTLTIPIDEKPKFFPNSSDVLVFTCPEEEVLAISLFNSSGVPRAIWYNSSYPTYLECPIPLPEGNH